jgi:thiol:disulfide interchange protein DsbC
MMKLSMLRLLSIIVLLSSFSYANDSIEKTLIKLEKQRIGKQLMRMGGELNNIAIVLRKDLHQDGWVGYTMKLDFTLKGKNLSQRDTLFSNGKMITMELIDIKTKTSYKTKMYPKLGKEFYDKGHLIEGNPYAKNTLVVFSDPLCPICIDEMPYILKKIIDNPKNIRLYYYALPLKMHPTSATVAKAAMLASEQGIKNVDFKIYKANLPAKYNFDAYSEKDDQKVLRYFNKEFGTHITMKQINDPRLEKMLQHDEKMSEKAFVNGTPTVFFNGDYDMRRSKFEKYL